MKKLLSILSIIILYLPLTLNAQKTTSLNTANTTSTILINIGCEGTSCAGLTIDSTAGGVVLTSSKYSPTVTDLSSGFSAAQRADCYNQGAKIWVTDNVAATLASGKGRAIPDGQTFSIYGITSITNFHAIRDAGVSSTLFCDYYRQP